MRQRVDRADCEAIAEIALRHDLTVLTDEVYWAIRYGDGTQHAASVLDVDGMADRTSCSTAGPRRSR